MTELPEYILERVFDAPREMVWRAWTDPALLSRWYGPNAETVIHKFDLKAGGVWLNEMKWGEKSNFQKVLFQEVTPREKLVWHHCSADSDWNVVANPMMPDWPRMLLTTVNFEDMGAQTNVRLSQVPMEATDAEIACFAKMMANMDKGWGSGYAIMDDLLAELQTENT
ncbi:MAG: SRPBCC domain-containing protein [Fimbriimonadaceae bacterium]|nr:SRPBCC domain-containing protein [Alphaproteobacteria bacterium]